MISKIMSIILFLFIALIPAQNLPEYKDIKIYKGDYSIIQFEFNRDISADSVAFKVIEHPDSSTLKIARYNDVCSGGDSTQIEIVDNTILVKLLTSNTSSLTPKIYYYALTDDSTTIFAGRLKIVTIGY